MTTTELSTGRSKAPLLALAAVLSLAAIETANALIAPSRAPTERDWTAVAASVRAGFRAGDLIVAAPEWADPILRKHLGDLIGVEMAGRLDAGRFERLWEVSQRGAQAPESELPSDPRRRIVSETRHGRLTLRLIEKTGRPIRYDFVSQWRSMQVERLDARGREGAVVCPLVGEQFQCRSHPELFVRQQTAEVDTRLRRAIVTTPTANGTVALEFPAARLGRELMVATGLHDVWARKYGRGTVVLSVSIDGRVVARETISNRSGWRLLPVDTESMVGKVARVRFELTSAAPNLRYLAIAAEARG